MQLQRYKHFCDLLRNDSDVQSAVISVELFRSFEGDWFDEREAKVEDAVHCTQLFSALSTVAPFRERNSTTGFISLPPFAAVAQAEFVNPPRRSSLVKLQSKIEECCRNAGHAFDAVHDSMTGLLNARGFLEAVDRLSDTDDLDGEESDVTAVAIDESSIGLLAIDIDYFKQVNDTFGTVLI